MKQARHGLVAAILVFSEQKLGNVTFEFRVAAVEHAKSDACASWTV
jgi:hypothetical protein